MIRNTLDLLSLLLSISPFLIPLLIWSIVSILLVKSIKKHENKYYWVFGIVAAIYVIPTLLRVFGITLPINITSLPILNVIFSEYSSAAYLVHPVIVIIMYMGALNPKIKYVGQLMSIRKQLSIIVGFSVLAHCIKRILFTFPRAWSYFANYKESVSSPRVVSELGSGITNFVLVLGIVMTILFLVLWITSFDSVRKKMGGKKWKRVQRWSYGLYAMLFIHAVGLQLGGLVSTIAREKIQKEQTTLVSSENNQTKQVTSDNKSIESKNNKQNSSSVESSQQKRKKSFRISDVKTSSKFRAYFNITIYILVYGSYLYFRLRKARKDKLRRLANRG